MERGIGNLVNDITYEIGLVLLRASRYWNVADTKTRISLIDIDVVEEENGIRIFIA